ncbi:chorismate mutase [Streptomyces werraensis]|uniref:chorismate mutase n=1 Tax=Streptomyces werraensis TaxID=68284 RepID=UPI00380DCCA2
MGTSVQPMRRLAYLGPEGTFTEQALRSLPESAGARLTPAATAGEALRLVCRGAVDAAMLPVHNTVAGPVADTVRALAGSPVQVLVDVVLRVEFALLVRPGTRLARIRTVSGHPHARAQVGGWLDSRLPWARWTAAPSNAEAARRVRDGVCDAAVAGEFTAAPYGLRALATGLQDTAGATTTFLLCALPGAPAAVRRRQADRTCLVGRHRGGPEDLRGLLGPLYRHPLLRGASLHVLPDGRDRCCLFADLPGSVRQAATARAAGLLQSRVPGLRPLGSYPSTTAALPCASGAARDPAPPGIPSYEYERSITVMDLGATVTGGHDSEPTARDIARLRQQIDALDRSLIGTLKQRLAASREIQRIRTERGGSPLDTGRELAVRDRYAQELGESGTSLAEALLELCRGRSGT